MVQTVYIIGLLGTDLNTRNDSPGGTPNEVLCYSTPPSSVRSLSSPWQRRVTTRISSLFVDSSSNCHKPILYFAFKLL
ncbi:hypothetical protein LXL04_002979 [Taraxacum kok-saghyz]